MRVYGYWHNRAVDGKAHCNHYAHDIGGECGKPELGVWVGPTSARRSGAAS